MNEARSILVVGAGAVGSEIAGEFVCAFPDGQKKIGLLTRGKRILPGLDPKGSTLAENFLKSKGCHIYTNTLFNEEFK